MAETAATIPAEDVPRRAPAGVVEHWCEHPGCVKWGGFGFARPAGTVWFCFAHRGDGERQKETPPAGQG